VDMVVVDGDIAALGRISVCPLSSSGGGERTETDPTSVTLEYAQMTNYRLFDPAGTGSGPSLALSIPLPSAVSAFVIPAMCRRGSANFFDLIERFLGSGEDGGWIRVPA
jgi:hypothetical protein